MNNTLKNEIEKCIKSRIEIAKILDQKIKCKSQKETLNLSYFDISIEHMSAIILLIQQGYAGSAFALIRPYYDTVFRGLHLIMIEDEEIVEKIIKNKYIFKFNKQMAQAMDKFYTQNDFFEKIHSKWWPSLCGYTHTDILPLSRRWQDGQLNLNYSDEEISQVLNDIRHLFVIFSYAIAKEFHLQTEQDHILKLWLNSH